MTNEQVLYFVILPIAGIGFFMMLYSFYNFLFHKEKFFGYDCRPMRIFNGGPSPHPPTCSGRKYPEYWQNCDNCQYYKNYVQYFGNEGNRGKISKLTKPSERTKALKNGIKRVKENKYDDI